MKDGYHTEHFRRSEFTCNHCHELPHDPPEKLLAILEDVREHFGAPVSVHSGYRCPVHNRHVGGAKHSQHVQGTACDFHVIGVHPHTVHSYLMEVMDGYGGLGQYTNFTHCDVRNHGPARW